jgi:hypothetical protein
MSSATLKNLCADYNGGTLKNALLFAAITTNKSGALFTPKKPPATTKWVLRRKLDAFKPVVEKYC